MSRAVRILEPAHRALVRFMGRAGLIAFLDAPAGEATPPAAAPAASAPPAGEVAPPAGAAPAPNPAVAGAPASSAGAAEGAPEAYTDFTLSEEVTILPDYAADLGGLAKDLGLTQEKAQKVVDAASKLLLNAQKQQADTLAALHADWKTQVAGDRELGGDKLDENLARAKAALEATSTPQLQVLLEKSGLGSHPDVIRHFLKIAPAFLPDTFVPGGRSAAAAPTSTAQRMFPNMNP